MFVHRLIYIYIDRYKCIRTNSLSLSLSLASGMKGLSSSGYFFRPEYMIRDYMDAPERCLTTGSPETLPRGSKYPILEVSGSPIMDFGTRSLTYFYWVLGLFGLDTHRMPHDPP